MGRRVRSLVRRGVRAGLLLAVLAPVSAAAQTPGAALRQRVREALSLEQAGDLAGAEEALHEVLADQPADVSALLALERVARTRGQLASFVPWAERAAETAPGNGVVRQVQLRVLADLDRAGEVRRAGADWVGLAPREPSAYRELAAALVRVGQGDSAVAWLQRGREALGGPPALADELAEAYLAVGRWPDAVAEWMRMVRQGAAQQRILVEKTAIHARRSEPAVRMLVDSLARPNRPPEQRAVGALAAVYVGEDALARRLAAEAVTGLAREARRPFAEEMSQAAARLGRPEIAAWSYALLLEGETSAAEWGETALRVARFDLERGDTAGARLLLTRTLERAPAGSTTHRNASALLVEVTASAGPAVEARAALERHRARYPGDGTLPQLAAAVAHAHIRADDLDAAHEVLDRFVTADLRDPAAAALVDAVRGRIALYAGDWAEAQERFRFAAAALTGPARAQAIELATLLETASAGERGALARALRAIEAGRVEEGIAEVERLPRASGPARPGLLLWAARHARAAGRPVAASLLRAVVEDHPGAAEAPAALLRLAEMRAKDAAGREEAQSLLERLILEYPQSALVPLARRRLDEVRARVPSS